VIVMKALEKIADREPEWGTGYGREIVCHRCGTQCVLPPDARLDETVCIGCVQRLADVASVTGWPRALRAVAGWADKATVRGPGYGSVSCPHCEAECVVEVGEAARTGCIACLRPLGELPLIRKDLAARYAVRAAASVLVVDDDELVPDGWPFDDDASCALFPGEPA
jgi:hypothetical protein